jgi:hypothetical protein
MHDEVHETEKRLETLSGKVADAIRVEKEAIARRLADSRAEMRAEYLKQANQSIKDSEEAIARGEGYHAQMYKKLAEAYLQVAKSFS